MPVVMIHVSSLTAEQKARVGDSVVRALHMENISPISIVVMFRPDDADIYLDGGLVAVAPEAKNESFSSITQNPAPAMAPPSSVRAESVNFRTRARRTKVELDELKSELVVKLQAHGTLSSFQAQDTLGLRDCDWAPATLRRFFAELEEEGAIEKLGQKRGTRYVWKGSGGQPAPSASILVKKQEAVVSAPVTPAPISEDEEARVQELLKAYAGEPQEEA